MRTGLKIALPLLIVGVAAAVATMMILSKEPPAMRVAEIPVPVVRAQTVRLGEFTLRVRSQGTVDPRTETVLVPEVAGRVTSVAPSFASGGFFEAGATLVTLDPRDFEQAVIQSRSALAQAELRLAQERAEAEIARREWAEIDGGDAPPLTRREPQLAGAQAALDAARAALARAERDLERKRIRAPYAGRVRDKRVDVGTVVGPGTPLATIYAIDRVEIRLPLADSELAFIDLPFGMGDDGPARRRGPTVTLRAEFAGEPREWRGRIVRTEGEIDPRSRLVHVVAEVDDPYGRGKDPADPPLAVGLWVEAEIEGRRVAGVALVPRSALRGESEVLIVDGEDRLRFRPVEVLRADRDQVLIGAGLADGERICLSPLAAVTDGMRVRVADGGPS